MAPSKPTTEPSYAPSTTIPPSSVSGGSGGGSGSGATVVTPLCVPGTIVGSQMYSATYSNLGPTPAITVYADEFSDTQCKVCTTCGSATPLAKIPMGSTSTCSSGTSYQVVSYKSTPTSDGVPQLAVNYKNTNYYASSDDCRKAGKAPLVITSKYTGDPVTRAAAPCQVNYDSCTQISAADIYEKSLYYGQSTYRPVAEFKPYAPYASESCAAYDLNYLALLVILVIPLLIGTLVGIFVPVKPCPGCSGNDPAQRRNIEGWVDPRAKFNAEGIEIKPLGSSTAGVTV